MFYFCSCSYNLLEVHLLLYFLSILFFPFLFRWFPRNMIVCWTWSHSLVRTSLLIMSNSGYPPNQGAFSTEQSRYPSHSVQYTFPSSRHQQVRNKYYANCICSLCFSLLFLFNTFISQKPYVCVNFVVVFFNGKNYSQRWGINYLCLLDYGFMALWQISGHDHVSAFDV